MGKTSRFSQQDKLRLAYVASSRASDKLVVFDETKDSPYSDINKFNPNYKAQNANTGLKTSDVVDLTISKEDDSDLFLDETCTIIK